MRAPLLALAGACSGGATAVDAATDAGPLADTVAPDSTLADSAQADTPSAVDATRADGGPLLPPVDAGDPFGDAGALGTPAWAPIEVRTDGSCPPLAACGGDVTGTWDVAGGCVEVPLGMALSACPGARVLRSTGRGRGRVTFERGFARRSAQWETEVEILVPAVCAAFVGGCAGIEATIRTVNPEAACATEPTGDCRCAARRNGALSDADAYTTTATQIVSTTGGRRWDYCITGERLRYRDASAAEPREPGQVELVRRAR